MECYLLNTLTLINEENEDLSINDNNTKNEINFNNKSNYNLRSNTNSTINNSNISVYSANKVMIKAKYFEILKNNNYNLFKNNKNLCYFVVKVYNTYNYY